MPMEALRYPFPAAAISPRSELPVFAITASFAATKRNNRHRRLLNLSSSSSTLSPPISCTSSTSAPLASITTETSNRRRWLVLMDRPPQEVTSKAEIVNYFVKTLEIVLRSEKDAQMSIYNVSCGGGDARFGFCCEIDENESAQLARVSGVLSVMPDPDYNSTEKGYDSSTMLSSSSKWWLFPPGTTKHWLVRMSNPGTSVDTTKAEMVDYCTRVLVEVLKNERDAQMCIYHVSWLLDLEFCCELDEDCARALAGVPGVLSVEPDEDFQSKTGDFREKSNSSEAVHPRTKKLFVTGLSFYTSEKTLREAFEKFGELVEVKIIIDKISKRSKGYAFVEYTTEAAASAALKEMNGKIINGWLIVVDVAKSPAPNHSSRGTSNTRASSQL
ncbi:Organelle RRM domain-containing protein 1, chloroplastic [Linum perenne]